MDRLLFVFLRLGCRLRGRCCFLILFDQAAHSIGWLCTFADPVFDSINVQRAIGTGFLWIVRANDLDEFPVARAASIGHYHFIVGAILRSFSA